MMSEQEGNQSGHPAQTHLLDLPELLILMTRKVG